VSEGVPTALLHNLKHNKVVHERVVFLTVLAEDEPFVSAEGVSRLRPWRRDFGEWSPTTVSWRSQTFPRCSPGRGTRVGVPPTETTYFLGRATIVPAPKPGMAIWRERLFAVMMRNASPATAIFELPPDRVVELGAQVQI